MKIVRQHENSDGTIELITDGGEKKIFSAIRGGVSFPRGGNDAYAVIVGQEYTGLADDNPPPGRKVVLAEIATGSLNLEKDFYSEIARQSAIMLCKDFFYEVTSGASVYTDGYYCDFQEYCNTHNSEARLAEAFDADNIHIGISRIQALLEKGELFIPCETLLFSRLQSLTADVRMETRDTIDSALNALRHVIGSYYRLPPRICKLATEFRPPCNWRAV